MVSNIPNRDMSGNAVGVYRADITPVSRIVATTVGRKEMLDELLEKLGKSAHKKSVQHYVFIGPRGIGKTHFLTLIENGIDSNETLKKHYIVVRFSEENNRILSFADFILAILLLLGEKMVDRELRELYETQSVNEDDQEVIDTVVPRLRYYHKRTGMMLLVLLENLDAMLTQQIKDPQDIHRLRTFLMDSPCITLVATSPSYFSNLYDVKSPLYDFLEVRILDEFSEEQTIDMIRRNLAWEKRIDILDTFDSLVPKIKTLFILTGGNPRLVTMFYELIAHDAIFEVKQQFRKLVDRISPFYQDRLKGMAPQERALLETIARMRTEAKTPAAIARRLRKKPQLVSALLQRATQAGFLTVVENPRDKRSRVYRIKEGFFDVWLAMSQSQLHGTKITYLADFLYRWFHEKAARTETRHFSIHGPADPLFIPDTLKNGMKAPDYSKGACTTTGDAVGKPKLTHINLDGGNSDGSDTYVHENEQPARTIPSIERCVSENVDSPHTGIVAWFDELIDGWKSGRTGDLEKAALIAQTTGYDFSEHGLNRLREELDRDPTGLSLN